MVRAETTLEPDQQVRELHEAFGELQDEGDDAFVEEGSDLLATAIQREGFFEGVETEHHGRPCFEVLVEGRLVLADVHAEPVGDDEFLLSVVGTQSTGPGETAVVDPREGEFHAVYSPVRSRSLHVYPDDNYHGVGYVPGENDDADRDVYTRERFLLREGEG